MTTTKIIAFLNAHDLISINKLEQKCGLPQSTIYKAKNGRGLPEKYCEALIVELKKYGLKSR